MWIIQVGKSRKTAGHALVNHPASAKTLVCSGRLTDWHDNLWPVFPHTQNVLGLGSPRALCLLAPLTLSTTRSLYKCCFWLCQLKVTSQLFQHIANYSELVPMCSDYVLCCVCVKVATISKMELSGKHWLTFLINRHCPAFAHVQLEIAAPLWSSSTSPAWQLQP